MKETLNLWSSKKAQMPGVLACVIRYPDRSIFAQSWSAHYPLPGLEEAWRTASESFHVLQLNRLPSVRLRWVYEHAVLHGARRGDGICFGILTDRELQNPDFAGVEAALIEFENLKAVVK